MGSWGVLCSLLHCFMLSRFGASVVAYRFSGFLAEAYEAWNFQAQGLGYRPGPRAGFDDESLPSLTRSPLLLFECCRLQMVSNKEQGTFRVAKGLEDLPEMF